MYLFLGKIDLHAIWWWELQKKPVCQVAIAYLRGAVLPTTFGVPMNQLVSSNIAIVSSFKMRIPIHDLFEPTG